MKIVFLNGGLGNQMFQYVFYRFGQLRNPSDAWFLDDSSFYLNRGIQRDYELESVFSLKPNLLSDFFDEDVWQYMIDLCRKDNTSIPQILVDDGTMMKFLSEAKNFQDWNPYHSDLLMIEPNSFMPDIADMGGNVYYHGYWLRKEWFRSYDSLFKREFAFPDMTLSSDKTLSDELQNENSVSIRIRRGDFLKLGLAFSEDNYRNMVEKMAKEVPNMKLFVFSDDIAYCKEHESELGFDMAYDIFYVEGHEGENAFRDMQLMSLCSNMIISNSSFSYMAAILNDRVRRIADISGREVL